MSEDPAVKDNLILFPPNRIANSQNTRLHSDVILKTLEEIKGQVNAEKLVKINQIMDAVIASVSEVLKSYQITAITDPSDIKYCVFMLEAIKSMLYKNFGVEHQFHDFIVNKFNIDELIKKDS